ncbi:MAG: hypothetical protein ABIY70_18310 [Capsulimonas sp.]|uniref:hypothetical protein n=1 Tax=Capsulimonas sp. TaxID=2494211 RepID=UPI00326323F5
MFHDLSGMTQDETAADNVRQFVGTGTPFLAVLGLTLLQGVRVGSMALPLTIEQEFPTDQTMKRLQVQTSDLVKLETSPDGEPFLLRSKQSNDGIWQKDIPIFVTGVWSDKTAPKKAAKPAAPADPGKMSIDDLKAEAAALKIADPDKLSQDDLIKAVIASRVAN